MLKKAGLLAALLLGVSSGALADSRVRADRPALPSSALETSARRDARMAMAIGDFRQRDPAQAKTEEGHRYAQAFNRTLSQERPYITAGNPLEESLLALARTPSPLTSQAFEDAFLSSKVYLVTTKEGQAETRPPFWRTAVGANADAMVVFTSEDRLREALTNEPTIYWVTMSGRDALRLGRGLPVAINPGLRPPAVIQPAQAESLLQKIGG
ncbi:SseB family protein [Caulobacter sp. 17J65-9]|uniref:SseB family protein n=1 Tax=Caulobacter sp. 17J65-9 TaxID=2709382 RepID=UPI0013CA849E|nr:SseB family protein [Caulobacter sp. 17J65-9]